MGSDGARPRDAAYRVLARELRADLLRNRYAGGRQLPTEAMLARRHGVGRQTVRRAFQDLQAEGMVVRVPGRGTFASDTDGRYLRQFGSVDDLMSFSDDTQFELVTALHRTVDIDAAGRLRLNSDVVHVATYVRTHNQTVLCATTVYLPPDVALLLADVPELNEMGTGRAVTVIRLLDDLLDDPIAEADQSISLALAPDDVADVVSREPGTPLLRADRLYLDTRGKPVELAVSHFVPEHYSYRVRLKRSGL